MKFLQRKGDFIYKKTTIVFCILFVALLASGFYYKNIQRKTIIEKQNVVAKEQNTNKSKTRTEKKEETNYNNEGQKDADIQIAELESINEKVIENDSVQEEVREPISNYAGVYSITAYTWTGNVMANGEYPYVGCAASCDFPIGTVINIEGVGNYVIKDVCPTSGVIDLYMNSYEDCITFGRLYANVYIQ